jgi:Mg-chelatase subunit ChlD
MVENDNESFGSMDSTDYGAEASHDRTTRQTTTTEDIVLSARPKNAVIGLACPTSTTQICVTMQAPKLPSFVERQPVDILVALDVSHSMDENGKLNLCKQTLELLLRHLLPQDRFGLVTYSLDAKVEVPMQLMTDTKKQDVLSKIKGLVIIGQTNMSAAIALSFQELRAVAEPNQVRSIFLLTDGHANAGLVTQQDLVELTRNCWSDASIQPSDVIMEDAPSQQPRFKSFFRRNNRSPSHKGSTTQTSDASETSTWTDGEPDHPISLFCFGYGADHNSEILREITNVTETGSYYFVKDDSNVGPAFGSAFGGILSVVGQSAVLTLQPCSGATIKAVHHESAIRRDDGSYTVSVGDFYAEESRDVVAEVTLASVVNSVETVPHLVASLAYTDVVRKMPIRGQAVVCSIARPSGTQVSPDDIHVSAQWLRVVAAQALAEAAQLANRNDKIGARLRLQSIKDQLRAAPDAVGKNDMIGVLLNDVETMMSLQDDEERGLELSYKCQAYQHQRSSAARTEARPAFLSNHKQAMAKKFALP